MLGCYLWAGWIRFLPCGAKLAKNILLPVSWLHHWSTSPARSSNEGCASCSLRGCERARKSQKSSKPPCNRIMRDLLCLASPVMQNRGWCSPGSSSCSLLTGKPPVQHCYCYSHVLVRERSLLHEINSFLSTKHLPVRQQTWKAGVKLKFWCKIRTAWIKNQSSHRSSVGRSCFLKRQSCIFFQRHH